MFTNNKDDFDDLLLLENQTYENSKREGIIDGQKLGYIEGYQLGLEKGAEFGQEIGYYKSSVLVWNHLVNLYKENHKFSIRGLQNLEKLTKLLDDYKLDFKEENPMETLSEIRNKFKLTETQLGLQTRDTNELSF
ncbi:DUF1715 family protein [Tieghemostelium lacteum]|uniref:DUF1715 family protein n=1 Tax=Tieghemostelium lacteum TaxID=361077 RepID=A0A151Z8H0_TIELA|nr:DUF1715 family protein [Tieghemostelium lacteum]|eukprot:KYQ90237.1 DUF1715 family protein [Tieghemostelium lacteum]